MSSGSSSSAAAPWHLATDVALPCATQNELDAEMRRSWPTACSWWPRGQHALQRRRHPPLPRSRVLFAPGKAANAGGVATSGLEMSQNAQRLSWSREEVDARLKGS
jgi:glutamate dehydrogenase (NADP+)